MKRTKPDIGHLVEPREGAFGGNVMVLQDTVLRKTGNTVGLIIDKRGIEVQVLFSGDGLHWVRRASMEVISDLAR